MADDTPEHKGWFKFFFPFFFVCFFFIMAIGAVAIFTYNANAPEPAPAAGGHGSMLLPQDGEYAPHVQHQPLA